MFAGDTYYDSRIIGAKQIIAYVSFTTDEYSSSTIIPSWRSGLYSIVNNGNGSLTIYINADFSAGYISVSSISSPSPVQLMGFDIIK